VLPLKTSGHPVETVVFNGKAKELKVKIVVLTLKVILSLITAVLSRLRVRFQG